MNRKEIEDVRDYASSMLTELGCPYAGNHMYDFFNNLIVHLSDIDKRIETLESTVRRADDYLFRRGVPKDYDIRKAFTYALSNTVKSEIHHEP